MQPVPEWTVGLAIPGEDDDEQARCNRTVNNLSARIITVKAERDRYEAALRKIRDIAKQLLLRTNPYSREWYGIRTIIEVTKVQS